VLLRLEVARAHRDRHSAQLANARERGQVVRVVSEVDQETLGIPSAEPAIQRRRLVGRSGRPQLVHHEPLGHLDGFAMRREMS